MIHEESAQVGDKTPPGVGKNPYHAIRDAHTMRAASSSEHGIKIVSDETTSATPLMSQSARLQYNHGILSTFTALTLTSPCQMTRPST